MKILVYSHDWAPAVGGTQTAMTSLASGFASELRGRGDSAGLPFVTSTPAGEMDDRTMPWLLRKKIVIQHHNYQAVCRDGLLLQNPERSMCSKRSSRHCDEPGRTC